MEPQTDTLYQAFDRNLYKVGVAEDPTSSMISSLNSNAGSDNSQQLEVAAETLGSGVDTSSTDQGVGYLAGGKTKFDNTQIGYILGIDKGVAKFYLGNSTNYITFDGTSTVIVGGLSVSSLNIPDTVTANSFHVDSSGNAWWGATAIGSATAKVLNTGVATFTNATITGGSVSINSGVSSISTAGVAVFKSVSIINQMIAGESVTMGAMLCFKNKFACWGDDAGADRNTTAVMNSMVYVNQNAATTNYQATKDLCFVGPTGSGGQYITYLKLEIVASPPGLPAWNEIDTIFLRLYVVFAGGADMGNFYLTRLTSAFTESTVTYNTRPSDDSIKWSYGVVVTESALNENNASVADGNHTGYIDFDITEIYRLISQGTYTNNGFMLLNDNGPGNTVNCRFGGMTRVGGGTFNQAPFIVSYITKDNPGAGNTMVANDGKVYSASNSNYQRVKQLAGICGNSASAGQTVDVYSFSDGLLIPTSVLNVTNNQTYYLNSSSGSISILTNNILEHNKWDIKIGVGTPNGLIIQKETKPIFIRSISSPDTNGLVRWPQVLPPPDCTMIVMKWQATSIAGSKEWDGQLTLTKGFVTSARSGGSDAGGNLVFGSITWATGTAGVVTPNTSDTNKNFTVYFYK